MPSTAKRFFRDAKLAVLISTERGQSIEKNFETGMTNSGSERFMKIP